MVAEDFRSVVGSLQQLDESTLTLENIDAFQNEIVPNLRVLARATASDKYLLVVGLKALGHQVASTGDGINDRESVAKADVGLAMGSGQAAVKDVADMIIIDDDFEATLRAIMWGRNIILNISRFLQF